MIDVTRFLQTAIDLARQNLPYTPGGTDDTRAARAAVQEAHANLNQADFFAAIDALGGHDAVIARILEALAS